jgi:hypothetical protein
MAKLWTHPGANYVVNADHVAYAWAEDVEVSRGGKTLVQTYLTFVLASGASVRNLYQQRDQRDAALRMFHELANAGRGEPTPPTSTIHEASLIRREIDGKPTLVLVGCTCGWRAADEEGRDPEDALAAHLAATRAPAR